MAATIGLSRRWGGRIDAARLWCVSIVFSVVLNLGLFGFMPDLVRQSTGQRERVESLRPVNVIRLKTPKDPPPQKEKPQPPKRAKIQRPAAVIKPALRPQPPRPQAMKFDFKPELPSVSTDLPRLPIASVAFEAAPLPEAIPIATLPGKADYGVGEIDGPLVAVSQVPPVYPLRARRKGIEGWVRVKFLVTEHGAVEQISIESAKPTNLFEKTVLNAVSSWKFKPGTVDGKPVRTWVSTMLEFKLQ